MCIWGGPRAWAHAPSRRLDDHRLVTAPYLDRDGLAAGRSVSEVEFDRQRQPVAAKDILPGGLCGKRTAPPPDLVHHSLELFPALGKPKECRGDRRPDLLAADDSGLLELAKPLHQ